MKTPWQYAESGTEYANQVALFMWANMAARFGTEAAMHESSYCKKGYAEKISKIYGGQIPELRFMHAIKNAGHGDAVRGARSAAEGVKAGVPDIFLPVTIVEVGLPNYCGLYIEMKRPAANGKSKGVASDVQNSWHKYLRSAGYAVETCYGWEAARDAILAYLGK